MKRSLLLTVLLLALIATLAACGGSAGGPAAGAKKTLVMGTESTFPPYEFRNDKNEIVGFDVDLANAIAKRLNRDLKIEARYKDQPAISIESSDLAAQFLPGIGAKLCSLVYKPLGLELLVQRPEPVYRVAPYDGNYVAQGECSGLDDMFPSIDACFYEHYPWRGTPIPDHGEVWSIPWDLQAEADRLHFAVHGVRFPYRLERQVSFAEPGSLRFDYRLSNLSNFDFDFMWAAHPMFYLEEGARLILPPGVEKVVTTLSYSGELGTYGDVFPWPAFTSPSGQARDLRRVRPKAARDAEKYFVKGRMPEGWCAVTFPRSDLTLALSFPVEQVPYLGVLPNEGGWQDLYNIFLEPATAPMDRLDVAHLRREVSTVAARGMVEWYLNITLSRGSEHS